MRSTVLAFLAFGSLIFVNNSHVIANCCESCEVDWSGFYIGCNTGWGWSNANWSATPFGPTASRDFTTKTQTDAMSGALLGGQIGINWQMKRWLLGIEADFDGTSINGYRNSIFPSRIAQLGGSLVTDTSAVYANIDWLGGLHGRLGRTWGSLLFYLTGGVVWERLTMNALNTALTGDGAFQRAGADTSHTTKTGWAIGAGCERMITSRWSVRAEYMYDQFSSGPILDVPFPNSETANNGASMAINNTSVNAIRLGLNYTFKRIK